MEKEGLLHCTTSIPISAQDHQPSRRRNELTVYLHHLAKLDQNSASRSRGY